MCSANENEIIKRLNSMQQTIKEIKITQNKLKTSGADKVIYYYRPSKCLKICTSICITLLLVFSVFIWSYCFYNSGLAGVNLPVAEKASENEISVKNSSQEIVISGKNMSGATETNIFMKKYVCLQIFYGVLLVCVISLLSYLALTDDDGIRFAKLNEIRDLRRNITKDNNISLSEKETTEKIEILSDEDYTESENMPGKK